MENLILDIKISIAEKDQEIWWLFYKYFDDFKNYTRVYTSHYCQLFTKTIIKDNCTHYYYINNLVISYNHGGQIWYKHGKRHRDGGPAVIINGNQEWYQNGLLHRDGGPAVIDHGDQYWYQHGKRHRDGGPAVIEEDGTQTWYQHGLIHRDDGPAIVFAGINK